MNDPWPTTIMSLLEEEYGDGNSSRQAESSAGSDVPNLMSDCSNYEPSASSTSLQTCVQSIEDSHGLDFGMSQSVNQGNQNDFYSCNQQVPAESSEAWEALATKQWDPQTLPLGYQAKSAGWQHFPQNHPEPYQSMYNGQAYGFNLNATRYPLAQSPVHQNSNEAVPRPQSLLGCSDMSDSQLSSGRRSEFQGGIDPKQVIPVSGSFQSFPVQSPSLTPYHDPYSASSSPHLPNYTGAQPSGQVLSANSGSSSCFPLIEPQEVDAESPPLQALPFGTLTEHSPQYLTLLPSTSQHSPLRSQRSPTIGSHPRHRRPSHRLSMSSSTSRSPETYDPSEMADPDELEELEKLRKGGSAVKKDRRRLQNRFAQRAFRARSRVQRKEAAGYVENIEERVTSQQAELDNMKAIIVRLQSENAELARRDPMANQSQIFPKQDIT